MNGTLEEIYANNELIQLNTKSYLNVLFSEKIKPLLAAHGRSLNKQQLQDKLSKDQEFFETFLEEYNTKDPSNGVHAFNGVIFNIDASLYQKIPRTMWKKAKTNSKTLGLRTSTNPTSGSWACIVILKRSMTRIKTAQVLA